MPARINRALENEDDATACVVEFEMEKTATRPVTKHDSQELRLLLVEDWMSDVYLAEELLDSGMPDYQWCVIDKPSIAKALFILHDMRFDMALVDLNLQDAEGAETVSLLHGAAPYLPIVVFSGTGDPRILEDALASGARFCIEKDKSTPLAMRSIIRTALENRP